jgi:hypothetical protein
VHRAREASPARPCEQNHTSASCQNPRQPLIHSAIWQRSLFFSLPIRFFSYLIAKIRKEMDKYKSFDCIYIPTYELPDTHFKKRYKK